MSKEKQECENVYQYMHMRKTIFRLTLPSELHTHTHTYDLWIGGLDFKSEKLFISTNERHAWV